MGYTLRAVTGEAICLYFAELTASAYTVQRELGAVLLPPTLCGRAVCVLSHVCRSARGTAVLPVASVPVLLLRVVVCSCLPLHSPSHRVMATLNTGPAGDMYHRDGRKFNNKGGDVHLGNWVEEVRVRVRPWSLRVAMDARRMRACLGTESLNLSRRHA